MRDIFEPQLSIDKEPDGEYTLNVVTLTPSSCYAAGEAVQGELPSNQAALPEALPVTLHIKYRDGVGLPYAKPVRHHLSNLEIEEGKTEIVAFVVVDGKVVGSSSINLKPTSVGSGKQTPIDTSDWIAWVPGSLLHVEGLATLPNLGYGAQLIKTGEQEDSKTLILELQVNEPSEDRNFPKVVSTRSVQYKDEHYTGDYEYIIIKLADGSTIKVNIETLYRLLWGGPGDEHSQCDW